MRRSFLGPHLGQILGVAVLLVAVPRWASAGEPARAPHEAFVPNQISDSLSIVDLAAGKAVAEIPVGGKPAGVAVAPDGASVYLSSPESKEIVVIDAEHRTIARRFIAGDGPLGIAVNPKSGRLLYVADWYRNEILEVDAAKGEILRRVAVGKAPSGLAVTPDGALLISADRDSNELSFIETAGFTKTGSLAVGQHPFGVTLSDDGSRAYTANVESNDMTVVDVPSRKALATVKVGNRPYAVAIAQGRAFVTDQHAGTVSVIDLATNTRIKAIPVGDFPEGIEATPDGRFVYVSCWDANVLEKLDAQSLTSAGQIEVANGPRAFGKFLR